MFRAAFFAITLISATNPALADEVTDTLSSAMQAYEDGDIDYAIEELEYAKQLLAAMKTEALTVFLPEAPDGWTREISDEMSAGLAVLGGGVGAEAEYTKDDERFSITIMANNPMVTAFGGMIASAGLLGAKIHRVGREKFMEQDGELTGLVDDRILVQAEGADVDTMLAVIGEIDFRKLGDFGR